jgi:hypothetical protein
MSLVTIVFHAAICSLSSTGSPLVNQTDYNIVEPVQLPNAARGTRPKIKPSVSECLDQIVRDMFARRPVDGRSVTRPNGNGDTVPSGMLRDMGNGDAANCSPGVARGHELQRDVSCGPCEHITLECVGGSDWSVEVSGLVEPVPLVLFVRETSYPHLNSSRNLKRPCESSTVIGADKGTVVASSNVVDNNRALKRKRRN